MRNPAGVLFAAAAIASSALPARADNSEDADTDKTDRLAAWIGSFSPDHSDPGSPGNGVAFGIACERRRRGLLPVHHDSHGVRARYPGDHSESDDNLGADLRVGIRTIFSSGSSLGFELRQLSLSGNFGLLSNNQSMSIGGRSVLVSYGWRL